MMTNYHPDYHDHHQDLEKNWICVCARWLYGDGHNNHDRNFSIIMILIKMRIWKGFAKLSLRCLCSTSCAAALLLSLSRMTWPGPRIATTVTRWWPSSTWWLLSSSWWSQSSSLWSRSRLFHYNTACALFTPGRGLLAPPLYILPPEIHVCTSMNKLSSVLFVSPFLWRERDVWDGQTLLAVRPLYSGEINICWWIFCGLAS